MTISNAERTQLRSVIRQQFAVLRAEVEQRRAELVADLERELTGRFAEHDKKWSDAIFLVTEAAREADRQANDTMRAVVGDDWVEREIVTARSVTVPTQERAQLRRNGLTRIDRAVTAAKVTLGRQEADLMLRLAQGALESEAARAFLDTIPTVGALVPSTRLLELEASLQDVLS